MKILFLSAASSSHTVKWVNALAKRNNIVYLAYNRDHQPNKSEIDSRVILIELKYSGGKAYYLNGMELNRIYKQIKPDIVNAHYASGYGTLARIAKLKPLLLSAWGSDVYEFPYKNRLNKIILTRNLDYATSIASTSYCMANQIRKVTANPRLALSITPFGVDLELFSKRSNHNHDTIVIGNIKNLSEVYRLDILIKAVARLIFNLKNKSPDLAKMIRLKIYGDGELKNELLDLIDKLELVQVVSLEGFIENSKVPDALSEFDIFCATSQAESFGVSLVEAMAMELPVVATDAEGFKEIIDNDVNGIIVEKNNVDAIASALEKLVVDKGLRKILGKNGRNKVEKEYDWNKNVDEMIRIYNSVIEVNKSMHKEKL